MRSIPALHNAYMPPLCFITSMIYASPFELRHLNPTADSERTSPVRLSSFLFTLYKASPSSCCCYFSELNSGNFVCVLSLTASVDSEFLSPSSLNCLVCFGLGQEMKR